MKLPKRIEQIIKRKDEFLTSRESSLSASIKKMQDALVNKVTAEIIPLLDVSGGRIRNTLKNYRLLASLDKVYKEFQKGQTIPFVEEMSRTITGITALNKTYFTVTLGLELPDMFSRVAESSAKKIAARIGLEGGEIVAGGFLETLVKNDSLLLELKQFMSQAITGQTSMKMFIKGANDIITGSGEKDGGIEKQFKRYAHDLYQQYDRAYAGDLARELKMEYFVYQGGTMLDSRDFCVAHNNKVFTTEESELWRTWTPDQGVYPEGYNVKQRDTSAVPSYLNYPGYEPLIDLGGYNCRHWLSYIPESVAKRLKNSEQT